MARVEVVNQNVGRQPLYGTGIWSDGRAHVGSPMRIAQDFGSDVVTVQEVLLSHFEQFKEHMGWYGEFVHKNEPHEELTGEYKGEAILSKYPIIDKTVIDLGTPLVETGKDFNLLVVAIDHPAFRGSGQTLNVATTHLWSAGHDKNGVLYPNEVNDDTRRLQAKKIADYLDPRVGWARRYILTGDFNTSPKTPPIDMLHRVNRDGTIGDGKFWEADQSHNAPTRCLACLRWGGKLARGGRDTVDGKTDGNGRKIDYWFASHRGASPHEVGIDMALYRTAEAGGVPHDYVMRGWVCWPEV